MRPRFAWSLTLFLCMAGLFPSGARAQIAIAHQPDPAAFYDAVTKARVAGRPTEAALLAKRPEAIDVAALRKAIAELDWVDVGPYLYVDRTLGVEYLKDEPCQLDLHRYLPDGGELHFSYNAACADKRKGSISHTNFQNPPSVRVAIKQLGKEAYWENTAYGVAELHRIVSFRNNVLIIDISRDGKPRSKKVAFRVVRVGIPRSFPWSFGEATPAAR